MRSPSTGTTSWSLPSSPQDRACWQSAERRKRRCADSIHRPVFAPPARSAHHRSGSLRLRVPVQLTCNTHHPAGSAPSLADRHPEDPVPTYQYACTECGHRFEAVQAFTDDSLTTCPVCGGSLRKVYGSVGVVFKGSGFYRTDSRAAATSTASSNGSGDKPAGGDKSGDKGGEKKVAATT